MLLEIKKTVETKETIELALPAYFKKTTLWDTSDYCAITESKFCLVRETIVIVNDSERYHSEIAEFVNKGTPITESEFNEQLEKFVSNLSLLKAA